LRVAACTKESPQLPAVSTNAQGRVLRLDIQDENLNSKMDNFKVDGERITNLEMETAAIYGLSALLGHHALSLNAIIANRASGTFSADPYKAVDELIAYTLDKLATH
jgi:uridine phosphorylase